MRMIDGGQLDDKIISVALGDKRYAHYTELDHMKPHMRVEIEYFYANYKDLEGKQTRVQGWEGTEYAHRLITESMERFQTAKAEKSVVS
jgi:inorganic pyrophosphatase